MVRKEKAVNNPVRLSANHSKGATGGGTANSASIDSAISATAPVTQAARKSR